MDSNDHTRMFSPVEKEKLSTSSILQTVYEALAEKGYNPVIQIVGYLLSGDPAYITSHKEARTLIRQVERDVLLEELVRAYMDKP